MTHEDVESWASHYERFHGMTRENFYFGTNDASGPEA